MAAIADVKSLPTEEEIQDFEGRIGFRLPDPLRELLKSSNAGYPIPGTFTSEDGTVCSSVQRFLGLHKERYSRLDRYWDQYRKRIPDDLMPIAHDSFGNLVCMRVSGLRIGEIFFWDHEKESEPGTTPDYSNVAFLAASLQEFLDSLSEAPRSP